MNQSNNAIVIYRNERKYWYKLLHLQLPVVGSLFVITPLIILCFLYQRVFISTIKLKKIIVLAAQAMFLNSIVAWICTYFKLIKWTDVWNIYQHNSIDWIQYYQKPGLIPILLSSFLLWSMVLSIALPQLILSYCCPYSTGYGYGLLNIHSLATRITPSRELTMLQDGILIFLAIHTIRSQIHTHMAIGAMFGLISLVAIWALNAVDIRTEIRHRGD
jgi:hypothetical protein